MQLSTIFREALQALVRNRVRSLLTMLGIVMGVGSFICVVAVGRVGSAAWKTNSATSATT